MSVRFDSARDLQVVSNLLALDATPSVVEDVLEVGGRVTGHRDGMMLIEPYYVTMYDPSRDDRERTFYRGGVYRLPDLAMVDSGGVIASDFITPAARKTRDVDNALGLALRLLPLLLTLSFLRGLGHW